MIFFCSERLFPFVGSVQALRGMVEGGSAFALAVAVLPPEARYNLHCSSALQEADSSFIYMT